MKKKDFIFPKSMGFVIEFASQDGKTMFILRSTNGNIMRFSSDKDRFLSMVSQFIDDILSIDVKDEQG